MTPRSGILLVLLILPVVTGCQRFHGPMMPDPSRELEPPDADAGPVARHRRFDRRPYEYVWANHRPDQDQLLDFERARDWRVEASEGARAEFGRSQQLQLWGEYVGRLSFSADDGQGTGGAGTVDLVLSEPEPVRDPVDTVTFWVRVAEDNERETIAPRLDLLFEDQQGEEYPVDMGTLEGVGWRLLQQRLPAALLDRPAYPLAFTGMRWSGLPTTGETTLFMDALCLFLDARDPLDFAQRPRRPLPLLDGQLVGVNTGEEELGFPVDPHTVIPALPDPEALVEIEETANGQYELRAGGEQTGPVYRLYTHNGLGPIEVRWEEEDEVAAGYAGLRIDGLQEEPGDPVVTRMGSSELYVEYERGDIYRVTVKGHSLVMDVSCRSGGAERVSLGGWEAKPSWTALYMPYLHHAADPVAPIMARQNMDAPAFIHAQIDPYRSNASELYLDASISSDDAEYRLGAAYRPQTTGQRNDLHERFVLTAARNPEAVLPRIPHPAGQQNWPSTRNFLVPGVEHDSSRFVESGEATLAPVLSGRDDTASILPESGLGADVAARLPGYARELQRAQRLRRLGVRDGLYLAQPSIWQHVNESRSFRLRANPFRGGDRALRGFIDAQRDAGWTLALYMNYREISPLNAFWTRDVLTRDVEGSWVDRGEAAYAVKPLYASTWNRRHIETLQHTFEPDAYWMDGYGNHPPWQFTDYDQRAPGSATFSQVYYADGDLFLETKRRTDSAVLASAQGARLYAGLADGLVGEDAGKRGPTAYRPFNPLFKLLQVHPLSVVYGAGVQVVPAEVVDDDRLDRYLADQIAYGNAGRLIDVPERPDITARSYHALRALQERYLLRQPLQIRYADGDAYVRPRDAFASGAWQQSRLYVQYPGDLELWVNGSDSEEWEIRAGSESYSLPPSGWWAMAPGFTAFSGLHEGRRIDYVDAPEYTYLDPRGDAVTFELLRAAGPVVVWDGDEGEGMVVLDILQRGTVSLHEDRVNDWDNAVISCFDEHGNQLEDGRATHESPWWTLEGPDGTRRFELN